MAKKKSTKSTTTDNSTTYSTRLKDDQRECIDLASKITGVSASKFIRDTALRAAADVVNSAAPNDRAITSIAQRLADSISNQQAELEYLYEDDQVAVSKASLNNGYLPINQDRQHEEFELNRHLLSVKINSLSPQDIRQLRAIAESCPFTFAQAFLKAMRGASEPMPEFSPRSNPDLLLSD